jgi:predicted enzyme related to lactoylglutathione lyase
VALLIYNPGMALVDKHSPGDFCWIELATTDQTAAKHFYMSLFGWSAADLPMGPNEFYTMFAVEGASAGAAYTERADEIAMGIPSHWNLYIAVENADQASSKAAELGAKVLAPPFDVYDVGRMSVLEDPTGAVFSVWQAKKRQGVGIAGVNGTLCWADLSTPDPERAAKFYSDLFGWKIGPGAQSDPSGYLHIQNGEAFIGGIPPGAHRNPKAPPHWLIYFNVTDVDASAAKAKELGASFHFPPMTMEGVGRMAVMADPQGAVSALFKESRRA